MSDFGSMVSQEVPGVWRQRVVCGGRIKKIKKTARREAQQEKVFGHRPAGVSLTWQHRYKGVAKNASAMASVLFVAFCPRPHERTEGEDDGKKLCRHPEEMQREAASAEKVTVCGDGENRGCLVLLRCL